MKRNLKALQWESDENNSGKDRVDDGDDDFKEVAQELSKEEGFGEPVQQIFLKKFGKIPNLMKKWKIKWKFMPGQKTEVVL